MNSFLNCNIEINMFWCDNHSLHVLRISQKTTLKMKVAEILPASRKLVVIA